MPTDAAAEIENAAEPTLFEQWHETLYQWVRHEQQLYTHLQPLQMLLLLDNFEQVVDAAPKQCCGRSATKTPRHAPH